MKFCSLVTLLMSLSPSAGLIGPMTKPNGDVDLVSITNHMTLMEQTMTDLQTQFQAASDDLTTVKADLKTTRDEFFHLQSEHNDAAVDLAVTQSQLKAALAQISSLKSDLRSAESEINVLKARAEVTTTKPPTTPTPVNVTVLDVIGRDVKSNTAEIANLKSELLNVKLDMNVTGSEVEMIAEKVNSSERELVLIKETLTSVTNETNMTCTLTEMDDLKQLAQNLESNMNWTLSEVENMKEHLNSSDAEVSDIKDHVLLVVSQVNNSRIDIDALNESVHDVEVIQQGHDVSLNNLSRAVDHLETDVAFQASPSAYYFDVKDAAKLVYDAVYYNVGDGYNGSSGEFTAPVSGTYMFWAGTSTLGGNTHVTIRLHVNHDRHGYLAQGTGVATQNSTESTAVVLTVAHLGKGDVVWLEKYSGTDRLYGTQESYIGGVLLRRQ